MIDTERLPEVECQVCKKMFKKFLTVTGKIGSKDIGVMDLRDMICSNKKCKEVFEETWNNKDPHCARCGKLVLESDNKEFGALDDDYKNRVLKPICDKCLD